MSRKLQNNFLWLSDCSTNFSSVSVVLLSRFKTGLKYTCWSKVYPPLKSKILSRNCHDLHELQKQLGAKSSTQILLIVCKVSLGIHSSQLNTAIYYQITWSWSQFEGQRKNRFKMLSKGHIAVWSEKSKVFLTKQSIVLRTQAICSSSKQVWNFNHYKCQRVHPRNHPAHQCVKHLAHYLTIYVSKYSCATGGRCNSILPFHTLDIQGESSSSNNFSQVQSIVVALQ